jgi:hypothetical protein
MAIYSGPDALKTYAAKLDRWGKLFPDAVKEGLEEAGQLLVPDIRQNYLSGQVLNVRTGALRGNLGYTTSDNKLTLYDDANNRGFYYGTYWLTHGRDFVNPSLSANKDQISALIQSKVMDAFEEA